MRAIVTAVLAAVYGLAPHASADEFDGRADANSWVVAAKDGSTVGSLEPGSSGSVSVGSVAYVAYLWAPACADGIPASTAASADCTLLNSCADPDTELWRLWAALQDGTWVPIETRCMTDEDATATPGQPPRVVTATMVLREIQRIGLPTSTVQIQPAGRTLVNFETILYAEPAAFTRTVTLLGQSVEVRATPVSWTWDHGDGSSTTTSQPGAAYPHQTLTHIYRDAQVTVRPSVDVVWQGEFSVEGGAWQTIPQTLTIGGPTVPLRVVEATPALSGNY